MEDYIKKHFEEHPEWYGAWCQNCGHCDCDYFPVVCTLTGKDMDSNDTCENWIGTT